MEDTFRMTEKALKSERKKAAKAHEKEKLRVQNEPPQLSQREEIGNAVTHGAGALLAVAGMILLLLRSETGPEIMAACIYGISLFLMMITSCLYHAFKSGTAIKRLWRRFDYASIYLLIGGTFAPVYLVYWGNRLGVTLFWIQWAIILFGITMIAIFGPAKWKPLHFTLYFTIGWSGLIFLPDFFQNNKALLLVILLGGLAYTLGMIPFAKRKKNSHFIWHIFVLVGAVLHWFAIYFFIY